MIQIQNTRIQAQTEEQLLSSNFWSLYCSYFLFLRLLITPLVSYGHCIVRTLSIYGFLLLFWYILIIVLSVLRLFTASDYFFGIFWSLYCPYFVYLRLLITLLVYFDHCIVRTSSIYGFWLLLWYILVIVLSVLRLFTASDYCFGIFWSLYCPYFVYLRLLSIKINCDFRHFPQMTFNPKYCKNCTIVELYDRDSSKHLIYLYSHHQMT